MRENKELIAIKGHGHKRRLFPEGTNCAGFPCPVVQIGDCIATRKQVLDREQFEELESPDTDTKGTGLQKMTAAKTQDVKF